MLGLGALIIANGLATSLSAPFWGYLGDRSSRLVMVLEHPVPVPGHIHLGCCRVWLAMGDGRIRACLIFLLLNIMHGGVRLGRKVYLVDMATGENRAALVAVSNTVIGVLMLAGGLVGLVGEWLGAAATVLLLGVLSLLAALLSVVCRRSAIMSKPVQGIGNALSHFGEDQGLLSGRQNRHDFCYIFSKCQRDRRKVCRARVPDNLFRSRHPCRTTSGDDCSVTPRGCDHSRTRIRSGISAR